MRKFYLGTYLCGLLLLLASWQAKAQTVFINELHYDNAGTDSGEGVEIAGPAGTDLTGWSVVFYNGGNGASYGTKTLEGILPNSGQGYGFYHISLPSNGLQNGAPDGLALINAAGVVVQFLSYEGTFAATNGPATGLTSTDLGVSQSGTEAAGLTLQLSGSGTDYTDFVWQSGNTSTWSVANNNQTFEGEAIDPTQAPIESIRNFAIGHYVNFKATLTAVNEFGGPAYVQDATGGIAVQDAQIFANAALAIGDEVSITGNLGEANGMLQIMNVSDFTRHGAGTTVLPKVIVMEELSAYEGQLVSLENVTFNSTGFFNTSTNYTITAGSATAQLRIDNNVSSLQDFSIPEGTTTVTGIIGSYNGTPQLMPRFAADVPDAREPAPVEADIATIRGMALGSKVRISALLTVVDQLGGPAFLQDATGGIALFDAQIHDNAALAIGHQITVTGTLSSFNGMLQIINISEFIDHGPASAVVEPAVITLDELAAYEGQLVTLHDVDFVAGGVFTTSTNYTLTDGTHTGQLRLDNNVTSLEGLAIPQGNTTVTGVIGSFKGTMQLMPRFDADVPTALPYAYPYQEMDFAGTLEVVSWNMEFFGATQANFGPNDEATQQANALLVLQNLQADIIAVQEISDEAVLQAVVAQLGEQYAISCSDKYSYSYNGPDPSFPAQKICFIYNTEVVELLEARVLFDEFYTELRTSGNAALLPAYPGEMSQFWSSGRLPYTIKVKTTIAGISEEIRLVNLHAKSGGNAEDYDRRRYDVQVLKDSLEAQYGAEALIILGDYNDDLDTSIAEGNESPYNIFVNSTSYIAATKRLSDAGFNSYLFNDDMIDHVILSDELREEYLTESASLFFPFGLVENYANSTSDHLPVRVRLQLQRKPLAITATVKGVLQVFNGYENAACTTLEAVAEGGEGPYSYLWSTGETTASITVCPTESQIYSLSISDIWGNSGTYEFSVCVSQVDCSNNPNKPKVLVSKAIGSTAFDLCLPKALVPYVLERDFMLGSINDDLCMAISAGERNQNNSAKSYRYVDVENILVVEGNEMHYLPLEKGSVTINLYDVNGRLLQRVFQGRVQFAEQISAQLHQQTPGLYLLRLSTDSGFSKTLKIQR